jgi:hypothetical protein
VRDLSDKIEKMQESHNSKISEMEVEFKIRIGEMTEKMNDNSEYVVFE